MGFIFSVFQASQINLFEIMRVLYFQMDVYISTFERVFSRAVYTYNIHTTIMVFSIGRHYNIV